MPLRDEAQFNAFPTLGQMTQQHILAGKARRFEESCVRLLLSRLSLTDLHEPMLERSQAYWGERRLAFPVFNELVPSFPFVLGSWQPTEAVHLDTRATEPQRFKQMQKVPFFIAYKDFFNSLDPDVLNGKKVALVFPRKSMRYGMVIHNDGGERFWRSGTCWVTKLSKGIVYAQPFTALVDGIAEHLSASK